MTMETIFLIVLAAFNVWTIYFYNKLLLEVANNKEEEEKPSIDPMALVGKSLFKVSQLRKKEETEQPKDTILDIPKHLESSKTLEELQNRYLGLSDNDKTKYAALTTAIKAKLIKTIK